MRYLILSDIHSNITAMEAALAAAEGRWDKAVCLGDLVGYGPDPNEVVDRVRALAATTIRGNHDRVCCGLSEADRQRFGAPPGWNCRDLQFYISRISFDLLGPERATALNKVETRFKLPPDQIDTLIAAGRDALNGNPKFREFMSSLGHPLPPVPRPATPVATPELKPHEASAE